MDILERIEKKLEEMVASGGAAMGGDGSMGTPGTTTSKVAKYEKRSSILTGGKVRKKKKKRDTELTIEAGDKRVKNPQDEVDHEDSEQKSPGKKRVKSGSQNITTGIGWHLRQS